MNNDTVVSLPEAVRTLVHDGDTVALEGFSHLIPFAAGHEIIRQSITGLTFCRMTPDLLSDMMIAAGCVDRLVCSFFASGSAGSLYEIRRRIESHDPAPLPVEEYSHHGMTLRYRAGAAHMPFVPINSYVGSDIPSINPNIRVVVDPYSGKKVYVVPPLNPDVTIIHAQRADRHGNVQIWGITGAQQDAVFAASRVIVTVEEIVDDDVVRADPNRTLIPSHAVDAVCVVPTGAHPSYVQGSYDRDNAFYREWTPISRDAEALRAWIDERIRATADHEGYLDSIGRDRIAGLRMEPRPSQPVDYGRRPDPHAPTSANGPVTDTAAGAAEPARPAPASATESAAPVTVPATAEGAVR